MAGTLFVCRSRLLAAIRVHRTTPATSVLTLIIGEISRARLGVLFRSVRTVSYVLTSMLHSWTRVYIGPTWVQIVRSLGIIIYGRSCLGSPPCVLRLGRLTVSIR